jgi:hypothetical protein
VLQGRWSRVWLCGDRDHGYFTMVLSMGLVEMVTFEERFDEHEGSSLTVTMFGPS